MLTGDAIMKKTMALFLASAMLFACVGCTHDNGNDNDTPTVTSQAGVVVESPDNRPTAGLNNTLMPVETYYVPEPTTMTAVTPSVDNSSDMSKPFEKGAYAVNFVKTPEKAEFSAPGYIGYTVAKSKADIDAYIAKFESMFDFDGEFKEAVSKYDDSFFANKSLIFIIHEEAEGQTSGRVKAVEQFEDYLAITLVCDTNWAAYADPSSVKREQWHCIIEMNSDDIINNDITVFEYE